jgi:dipeptidyl aminopeptidase/acylaminoacyl peptidase
MPPPWMSVRALCALAILSGAAQASAAASAFTIEQVLSAPFPSELISSPEGSRFAWVSDASGRRNVWLATRASRGVGFDSRPLTNYGADDGVEIADLAFIPHREALLYVRGGDPEGPDKPAPNPAHLSDGVEQDIFLIAFQGGAPIKLAQGHTPVPSPSGERVLFLRKGEVWSIAPQADAAPKQLFKARGEIDSLSFSPDGGRVAFVSERGDHSFIGVYTFSDQSLRWIDASLANDLEPRWSPDGKRLAFLRLPLTADEPDIGPHRTGQPWSIRVATIGADAPAHEVYRAPRGAGSVFHPLSSDTQLFWTGGDRLVFPSEADGWQHLYSVAAAGGDARLLTPGSFEIEYAAALPQGAGIVYAANAGDIDRRHLWRLSLPDGRLQPLTSGSGIETEPVAAADGTVALLHADATVPMRVAVLDAGKPRDLDRDAIPKDFPTSLVKPESVQMPERAGVAAHALLFLPPADGRRHPAVVFLHGGPIRQMLAGWHYLRYYNNAYGMNQYLASRGYVVLALNYRAGIGYGLDYREAEHYGVAGASEYNDVLSAAAYLRARPEVDSARIGLWGGSYGGYLTALGLARNSDLFSVGVDFHGVHDWHHWNIEQRGGRDYYSLDATPDVLATALAASPISSVPGWRSPVLLIHGDDDRNVAFSETVRLAEALAKQGVEYSDLVFPDEIHDFLRQESWIKAYHATSDFLDAKLMNH